MRHDAEPSKTTCLSLKIASCSCRHPTDLLEALCIAPDQWSTKIISALDEINHEIEGNHNLKTKIQ